jgi:hypothetical protein
MAVANSSTSRFEKASKNITDGRFVLYITGCVVNFRQYNGKKKKDKKTT